MPVSIPVSSPSPLSRGLLVGLIGLVVVLGFNWFAAVARFQVNGLFFDQWSFYTPLFEDMGWWAVFDWQHGPHRQGLGFLLTALVAEWSSWDSRVESLWIAGWLVVAAGLALDLKARLVGPLRWTDLWIPTAILSLVQYETVILVPNLSHSIMPLLLVLGMARLWIAPITVARAGLVALLGALALFTGFGLFAAVAAGALFAHIGWHSSALLDRRASAVGLVGLSAALIVFGWDYRFSPASEGFGLIHFPFEDYPQFVAGMIAARAGFDGLSVMALVLGGGMAVMMAALTGLALWRWLKADDFHSFHAGLMLVITGWLFVGFTLVGRVHLGPEAGMSSRYTTLVLPLWLGLLVLPWGEIKTKVRGVIGGLGWLIAVGPLLPALDRPTGDWLGSWGMRDGDLANLRGFERKKQAWIGTYRESGDWREAESFAPNGVYPFTDTMDMDGRLAWMAERELSFMAGETDHLDWLSWWMYDPVLWRAPRVSPILANPQNGARAIVRSRTRGYLNVTLVPDDKSRASPWRLGWGDKIGAAIVAADRRDMSLPLEAGDREFQVEGPGSVVRAEWSLEPQFSVWNWEGHAWKIDRALAITSGFYGWENGGEFGWTDAELMGQAEVNRPSFLNVWIESQFDPVAHGPVQLVIGDELYEFEIARDEPPRFSVPVRPAAEPIPIVLRNMAGARSPLEEGLWDDGRQLALRLRQFDLSADPAYPVEQASGDSPD